MRLALLPPDERPVHVRLPTMLADIAGAQLLLPPAPLRPRFRVQGDTDGLGRWLLDVGAACDVVIASIEGLCHGGLVPSRLSDDPTEAVVARLGTLRALRAAAPRAVLDASAFVTRLPDLDDAAEEPSYWATHGRAIAALSRALDRAQRGEVSTREVAAARAGVPLVYAADVLRRRARNHALLLAALDLAADGTLDGLVLSSDDTAQEGLPAREGRWVDAWLGALDLGARVDRYPGADEVAGVRTVRWLRGDAPPARVALLEHDGLGRIAPYEPHPIRRTALGQIRSVGAEHVEDPADADVVLAVTPPEPTGDWALAPPASEPERDRRQSRFADLIADVVDEGAWVAVADCCEPNGGSAPLVARLAERGVLARLGGYAGWNTAGNSIGSALAHAVVGRGRGGPHSAHERLLAHRLLEDVGYQTLERTALRSERQDAGRPPEPSSSELSEIEAALETRLQARLASFGSLGARWRLTSGSVRLPWARTFECDLALEATDG